MRDARARGCREGGKGMGKKSGGRVDSDGCSTQSSPPRRRNEILAAQIGCQDRRGNADLPTWHSPVLQCLLDPPGLFCIVFALPPSRVSSALFPPRPLPPCRRRRSSALVLCRRWRRRPSNRHLALTLSSTPRQSMLRLVKYLHLLLHIVSV